MFQASAQSFISNLFGESGSRGGLADGSVSVDASSSSGGLGSLVCGLIPPNCPALLNKTEDAIANVLQTATGPKSPLSTLNKGLANLKNVLSTVTSNTATIAVNASTQVFQEIVNQAKNAAGSSASPAVSACISTAQISLNENAVEANNYALSCSANIGKETTSLALQAEAFDIGLKEDLLKVGITAVAKCFVSILPLNNSIEKCFDAAVNEVQNYANGQCNNINNAIEITESLSLVAEDCISSATHLVYTKGHDTVTQLRNCMSELGVEFPYNSSYYLKKVKKDFEVTASEFRSIRPIYYVNKSVLNLQAVIASITPNTAFIAVNASTKTFQEFINQARIAASGSTNPAVGACISTAQKSFSNIVSRSMNNTVSCSTDTGTKADYLYVHSVAFDIDLKKDLLKAGETALAKCSASVLSLVNTTEQCIDGARSEFYNFYHSQYYKITNAITIADSLSIEAERCTSAGADFAEKGGQAVVTQLRACLNGQGVSVQTRNNTAELKSGKAALEEVVANLNDSVQYVLDNSYSSESIAENIGYTDVKYIFSILYSLNIVQSNVLRIEVQMKSNTNTAVKECIISAKSRLVSLETSAMADLGSCVKINKDKVIAFTAEIAAQALAIKENLENAILKAEQKCSYSTTANSTRQCFVDAELKFKANVEKTIKYAETLSNNAVELSTVATYCINSEVYKLNPKVDVELASCLAGKGVKVTIPRY